MSSEPKQVPRHLRAAGAVGVPDVDSAGIAAVEGLPPPELTAGVQVGGPAGRPAGVWWAWKALDGNHANAELLAAAIPGGAVLDPEVLPIDEGFPLLPVVGVVTSDSRGLVRAQVFAHQVYERKVHVELLGLVIVADSLRKLPRELETVAARLEGAYPHVWRAGWVEAWRRGDPPTPANTPIAYRQIAFELCDLVGIFNILQRPAEPFPSTPKGQAMNPLLAQVQLAAARVAAPAGFDAPPTAPPGLAAKASTLIGYTKWGATFIAVIALIVVGVGFVWPNGRVAQAMMTATRPTTGSMPPSTVATCPHPARAPGPHLEPRGQCHRACRSSSIKQHPRRRPA